MSCKCIQDEKIERTKILCKNYWKSYKKEKKNRSECLLVYKRIFGLFFYVETLTVHFEQNHVSNIGNNHEKNNVD